MVTKHTLNIIHPIDPNPTPATIQLSSFSRRRLPHEAFPAASYQRRATTPAPSPPPRIYLRSTSSPSLLFMAHHNRGDGGKSSRGRAKQRRQIEQRAGEIERHGHQMVSIGGIVPPTNPFCSPTFNLARIGG